VTDLLGWRPNGHANTSDANDVQSRTLGATLLEVLGIGAGSTGAEDPGSAVEVAVQHHLTQLRPDLEVARSRASAEFAQYQHLAVFKAFAKRMRPLPETLFPMRSFISEVQDDELREKLAHTLALATEQLTARDEALGALRNQMPEESLLKIDLTVGETVPHEAPRLCVAVSSKWTLRTDRAQDCLSQGAKLVSLRRGPMPHYAVLTAEPRPNMLKILADGSGSLDCVYHLHLPALAEAVQRAADASRAGNDWPPARTFRRLLSQGRLRDYDDLVREVQRVPQGTGQAPAESQRPQGTLFDPY
jgi:hypothetical protein